MTNHFHIHFWNGTKTFVSIHFSLLFPVWYRQRWDMFRFSGSTKFWTWFWIRNQNWFLNSLLFWKWQRWDSKLVLNSKIKTVFKFTFILKMTMLGQQASFEFENENWFLKPLSSWKWQCWDSKLVLNSKIKTGF